MKAPLFTSATELSRSPRWFTARFGAPRLLSIGIHAALVGISLITWTAAPALRPALQEPVVLQAIIRRDGRVDVLNLVRSLGFGLGQNAIEALKQWRFRPATKDGQAVDSTINIEVRFNLR